MMRALLGLSVVAVSVLGYSPRAALADQYVADHCTNWDSAAGGVAFGTVTGATANTCGAAGGSLRLQAAGATVSNAQSVTIKLAVPADRPNVQIERAQTEWAVPAPTTQYVFMPMFNGFGQEVFNAQPPARPKLDLAFPPGNRSLSWSVYCGGSDPVCGFASDFIIDIYRTRLYLNESVAPTLSVNGGALLGTGAKSGQLSVLFDAADTDSGVASASVALGSTVVASAQYPCAHQDWSACPRAQNNSALLADTTKVPDGTHEVLVTVRDAASNATTRSLSTIAVANGAGAGAANGTSASRAAKLTARYTTTKARSRRLRYSSHPTVRGTLVDERGQPIRGASVAVLQRHRKAGARSTQIATVTTGADGRFSYKLGSGPSRTLVFAYTAFAGDAKPAASSVLRTMVRAIVSLAAAPRSPRVGELMTLSGRLRLLPRAGVEVKIQPRQGLRWYTFGTVKTTKGGRFRWRYRFDPSKRGSSFLFRVRVDSPIYPFAPGNSRVVRIHVR
jgi:hypothetical protein